MLAGSMEITTEPGLPCLELTEGGCLVSSPSLGYCTVSLVRDLVELKSEPTHIRQLENDVGYV